MADTNNEPRGCEGLWLTDDKIAAILNTSCGHATPCVISPSDMTVACHARFVETDEANHAVAFDILDNVEIPFHRYFTCCVSFYHAERTWMFITQVRDFTPAGDATAPRLVLKSPSHIIGNDLRRTIRIAVVPDCDFTVRTTIDEHRLEPHALEVGLGGMSIEFPEGSDPDLSVGDCLAVDLLQGAEEVTLKAEVRHRSGRQYGLLFPEIVTDGAFDPPAPYPRILKALERQWFSALWREK